MLNKKTVAVVVPCFNEETQISNVLNNIPDFVDLIIVVDDFSNDRSFDVLNEWQNKNKLKNKQNIKPKDFFYSSNPYDFANNEVNNLRKKQIKEYTRSEVYENINSKLVIIKHRVNSGAGAAIASGYKYARDCSIDCTAVVDGDGQMDTRVLKSLCQPIVDEIADYCKGNRLRHLSAKLVMPKIRYFGNSILSILTKVSSGYWKIKDTQSGFTAISLKALENIEIFKIYKSYGYPNDILVKLNIA